MENSIVSALASDLSLIGLSQNLNSPEYSEPTGGWEWVTGQPLDFTSWGSGEPNNGAGDQHYAVTNFSNTGIWDDQRLSQTVGLSYIMERSNEFVLGCTDIYADNFNESATEDDGSCFGYPNNGDFSINFDGEGAHVNLSLIHI